MDFYEKLNSDYYKAKAEDPPESAWEAAQSRPLLRKMPEKMTEEELSRLPSVMAEYQAARKKDEEFWAGVAAEQERLSDEFVKDLFEHHGLPPSHPFVQAMYEKAFQDGHAYGYSEVASHFSGLVELWDIAVKCGMRKEGG